MMRKKRFYQRGVLFAAVVAAASVSGCGNAAKDAPSSVNGAESEPDGSQDPAKNGQSPFGKEQGEGGEGQDGKPFYAGMSMSQTPDVSELLQGSLDMKDFRDKWVYYDEYACYGLEYLVYCDNPADQVKECLHIYVPAAYMNADGTINEKGQ